MIETQEAVAGRPANGAMRTVVESWPILSITVVSLLLYRVVLIKLLGDWWTDPNFSHGFIVPLFSAFWVYRDRARLAAIPKKATGWGLAVVAAALAWLVVGVIGAELFLSRTSGIALLAGLVLTFWGWQRLRALAFPIAFLLLAIPIPSIVFNQITFPLQLLTSRLAADVLPLLQVPVLREGNVIRLPAMPLEVAEACSGIRSLLSLGTLAVIYGALLERSMVKRVVLALASVPIAVAANALRIVGTGLCVQYWDPDKALGFFHEFSGWVIFLFSLAMLIAVQKGLSLFDRQEKLPVQPAQPIPQGMGFELPATARAAEGCQLGNGIRFAVTVVLLMATAAFLQTRSVLEIQPKAQPLAALPTTADGWQSVDRPVSPEVRQVLGPGDFLNRLYLRDGDRAGVDLFIAYFPSQRAGDTIHSPKNCLPGAGWVFESSRHVPLNLPGMKPLQVNESVLAKGSDRMLAIYWYQAHGRAVASEYWAKFYLVADAMRLNRTDGALVRLVTPILPGETLENARSRTIEFAAHLEPRLRDYIPD